MVAMWPPMHDMWLRRIAYWHRRSTAAQVESFSKPAEGVQDLSYEDMLVRSWTSQVRVCSLYDVLGGSGWGMAG